MDITDPKAMRALAHPLRIRLLEVVAAHGPITAARASGYVDESPSNCSFHLRTLAQHGYIERASEATGRDKPWQITDITQNLGRDQTGQEAQTAAVALGEMLQTWEFERIRAGRRLPLPDGWKGHLFEAGSTLFLTPEEADAISESYRQLIAPYLGRITDPAQRPADAAPVRVFMATTLAHDLMAKEADS
ncbi:MULTISPECIES: winged helix-turn-helix domain-containing protein [Paeniglutamicibacter]|uniref:DNA-binding transcriptional ArsR family regulator n=1 Tax=Paeniglutamicibacter sulfureus TaxID=43666 RepID=A0ABU2BDG9_9MICC|nr:winged helix-turn-helix domain-containing protein [Paeniglutamicibacter sulfureus]MDR7356692.1 DNA-binding transcriptional ArsR family regulator [Paeniglutamicibacter sulfureus]